MADRWTVVSEPSIAAKAAKPPSAPDDRWTVVSEPQPVENAADVFNTVARNLSGASPATAKHLANQAPQMATEAVRNPPAVAPKEAPWSSVLGPASPPEPEPEPWPTSTTDQPIREGHFNLPRTLVGLGDALAAEPIARQQLAEDKARGWQNPTLEHELQQTKVHGFMEKNAEAMDANKQAREDASVSGDGVAAPAFRFAHNVGSGISTLVKSIVNLANDAAGYEFAPKTETDQQHAEKLLGEMETLPGVLADMARGLGDADGSNTLLAQPVEAWFMLLDPALKTLRTVPKFSAKAAAIQDGMVNLIKKTGAKVPVPDMISEFANKGIDLADRLKTNAKRGLEEAAHQGPGPEAEARQHEVEKVLYDPDVDQSTAANYKEMAARRIGQGGVELVQPDLEPAELRIQPEQAAHEAAKGERAIAAADAEAGKTGGREDAAALLRAHADAARVDVGAAQRQAVRSQKTIARASTDIDKLLDQQANPQTDPITGGKLSNRMGDLPRVQSAADKVSAAGWDIADVALPLSERLAALQVPKIAKEELAATRAAKAFDKAQAEYLQAAREAKVDPDEFANNYMGTTADGRTVDLAPSEVMGGLAAQRNAAAETLATKQVSATPTADAQAAARANVKAGKSAQPKIYTKLKDFERAQNTLAKEVAATVDRVRVAAGKAGQAGIGLAEKVLPIDAKTPAQMAAEVAKMQRAPARAAERAAIEARAENSGAGERPEVRAGTVYVPQGSGAYGVITTDKAGLPAKFPGTHESTLHQLHDAAQRQSRLKHVVDRAIGRDLETYSIEPDAAKAAELGLPNDNFYDAIAKRARDLTSRNITDPAELASSVKQLIDRTNTPLDTISRIDRNANAIADWLLAEAETANHSNRLNVERGVTTRPVPTVERMVADRDGRMGELPKSAATAVDAATAHEDAKKKYVQDVAHFEGITDWQNRFDAAHPDPSGLPNDSPSAKPEPPADLGTSADRAARKEIRETQDRQLLRDPVGATAPETPKPFLTNDPKVNESLAYAAKVFKDSAYHLERLFPEWGGRELTPERLMQRMLEPLQENTASLMRVRQVREKALELIHIRAKAAGMEPKAIAILKQAFNDKLTEPEMESAISKNRFLELDGPEGQPLFRQSDYRKLVAALPAAEKAAYQADAMRAISRTMGNAQYAQQTLGSMAALLYKFFEKPTEPGTLIDQTTRPNIAQRLMGAEDIAKVDPKAPKQLDPDVHGEIGQYALNLIKGVVRDKQPVLLIPYEGPKLAQLLTGENAAKWAARLDLPVEKIRALGEQIAKFKSSPSMNAAMKRISSQQFKGMDAPPELINMHGHPAFIASLVDHINALSVLDEFESHGTQLFSQLLKASRSNLVARSAAALINNDVSNFIQSIVTRADPRTPGNLVVNSLQLKKVMDGNTAEVPAARVEQIKALAGTSLFNSSKLSRDIGETNLWKALKGVAPESTSALERMARTGRESNSKVVRGIAKIPDAIGDINHHLENFYSTLGDNVYKTEHALAHMDDSTAKENMLGVGKGMELQVSPVRKVTVTKRADGGFNGIDSRNPSVVMDGSAQVAPGVTALQKWNADAAYHATEKLYTDAQRGGNIPKYMRSKAMQPVAGIFGWTFRSMDIPGIKEGFFSEILKDGFARVSNDPAVIAFQAVKGQTLAIRRAMMVGMANQAFADQRKLAALSRSASYNAAQPGALLNAGADAGYADVRNTENTNFVGPTGAFGGLVEAAFKHVAFSSILNDPVALRDALTELPSADDFEGPMLPGQRAQILRNQRDLRSSMRGEVASLKQLAGLFGATGAPLITTASRFINEDPNHPYEKRRAMVDFAKEIFGSSVAQSVNAGLGGLGVIGHAMQNFNGHPQDERYAIPQRKLGDLLDWAGDFSTYGIDEVKQGVKGDGNPQSSQEGFARWAWRTLTSLGTRTVYLGNQHAQNPATGEELWGLLKSTGMRVGKMVSDSMLEAAKKHAIKARGTDKHTEAIEFYGAMKKVATEENARYRKQLENESKILSGQTPEDDKPTQDEVDDEATEAQKPD